MNHRSVPDAFRSLGTPEELEACAAAQEEPASPLKSNAHIHVPPNFSAFDSVRHAVTLASAQGVRVLGLSNYYDFAVYADFSELCRSHGVFPLYGLEIIGLLDDLKSAGLLINDPGNPGRMYLCGKGISCLAQLHVTAGLSRMGAGPVVFRALDRLGV